jgi:hypothetical protein
MWSSRTKCFKPLTAPCWRDRSGLEVVSAEPRRGNLRINDEMSGRIVGGLHLLQTGSGVRCSGLLRYQQAKIIIRS